MLVCDDLEMYWSHRVVLDSTGVRRADSFIKLSIGAKSWAPAFLSSAHVVFSNYLFAQRLNIFGMEANMEQGGTRHLQESVS